MKYCTYIYRDPKNIVPIYVGMGLLSRPGLHLKGSHNTQLDRTIKKRVAEGFQFAPRVLEASSREDAIEMETCLIALIGRADKGQGTLFNRTDGGDGGSMFKGRHHSAASRQLLREIQSRAMECEEVRDNLRQKMRARAAAGLHTGGQKSKACAVHGKVYPSRQALIDECGQGKAGLKHSSFQWITE